MEQLRQNIEDEAKKEEKEQNDSDAKSVFIKNVEYKTTPEELQKHFEKAGNITRVTIFRDPVTRHPLG